MCRVCAACGTQRTTKGIESRSPTAGTLLGPEEQAALTWGQVAVDNTQGGPQEPKRDSFIPKKNLPGRGTVWAKPGGDTNYSYEMILVDWFPSTPSP